MNVSIAIQPDFYFSFCFESLWCSPSALSSRSQTDGWTLSCRLEIFSQRAEFMVPSAVVSRPDPDKAGPHHHTDTAVLMPAAMMFFCWNAVIVLSCQLALTMLHAACRCSKRRWETQLHSSPLCQHLKAPWNSFVSHFMLLDDEFTSHLLFHFVRWIHNLLLVWDILPSFALSDRYWMSYIFFYIKTGCGLWIWTKIYGRSELGHDLIGGQTNTSSPVWDWVGSDSFPLINKIIII